MAEGISRRLLLSVAALPAAGSTFESQRDTRSSKLWTEFEELAARLENANVRFDELERFENVFDEICSTTATTIDGLCVKARVGCWTLMGDFESANKSAPGAAIAFSIMNDLIRTYHPELEKPGALQKLLDDIE